MRRRALPRERRVESSDTLPLQLVPASGGGAAGRLDDLPAPPFEFTKGTPARYRSSPVVRTFCARCGTSLTYQHTSFPDEIDVTIASLDDPAVFPPADHIWTSERIAWLELGDGLLRFPRSRFESTGRS